MLNTEDDVYAIDKTGRPILKSLLRPFFRSLHPALIQHAERIEVHASLSSNIVRIFYWKGVNKWELEPDPDFQPFVASSRIRMLAGMSIDTNADTQHGMVQAIIEGVKVECAIEIGTHDDWEILRIRPNWHRS